jgi:hypothetical protein
LVSVDGLAEGLPLQLGFIGQSLADQVEVGGHSPSGLLHGLV